MCKRPCDKNEYIIGKILKPGIIINFKNRKAKIIKTVMPVSNPKSDIISIIEYIDTHTQEVIPISIKLPRFYSYDNFMTRKTFHNFFGEDYSLINDIILDNGLKRIQDNVKTQTNTTIFNKELLQQRGKLSIPSGFAIFVKPPSNNEYKAEITDLSIKEKICSFTVNANPKCKDMFSDEIKEEEGFGIAKYMLVINATRNNYSAQDIFDKLVTITDYVKEHKMFLALENRNIIIRPTGTDKDKLTNDIYGTYHCIWTPLYFKPEQVNDEVRMKLAATQDHSLIDNRPNIYAAWKTINL